MLIPSDPFAAWADNKVVNSVPILVGSNHDEGQTFIYAAFSDWIPEIGFEAALYVFFGTDLAPKIIDFYKVCGIPVGVCVSSLPA